jgi:hypothetical protein
MSERSRRVTNAEWLEDVIFRQNRRISATLADASHKRFLRTRYIPEGPEDEHIDHLTFEHRGGIVVPKAPSLSDAITQSRPKDERRVRQEELAKLFKPPAPVSPATPAPSTVKTLPRTTPEGRIAEGWTVPRPTDLAEAIKQAAAQKE